MSIEKSEINGNPNVGLYAVTTKNFTLIPENLPQKFLSILEQTLKVPIVKIFSETTFIGALAVANQTGIVLSPLISESSIEQIRHALPEINVLRIEFDYFAFGNLAVTTESQTLLSPIIPKSTRQEIADTLGTEILTIRLQDSDLLGSLVRTNNKGAVVSPIVENEAEIKNISELLHLKMIQTSTVNRGSHFPAGGIITNDKGAILGINCTGLETIAISNALFP